jgi:regulator of replication initiation timing
MYKKNGALKTNRASRQMSERYEAVVAELERLRIAYEALRMENEDLKFENELLKDEISDIETLTGFRKEEPAEEVIVKKHNSRSKAVICVTTGMTFDSIKEAAEYYGMKSANGISKCCNGKQKSAGKHNGQKLEWQFAA